MLADELLRGGSGIDQLGVGPARNRLPPEPADGVHQTHIQEYQLEGLLVHIGLERKPGALAVGHPGDHARHLQQVDVPANGGALIVGRNVAVLDLASGMTCCVLEYPQHAGQVPAGGVLREVVAPRIDDAGMDRGDRGQIFRLGVDPDRFGHAPDEQVETQKFQQALVNQGVWLR